MEYKIGDLKLKNSILLAPMLEPNDIAFRLLCKRAGCGLTYTGMVSPLSKGKLDLPQIDSSCGDYLTGLDDEPAVQLFGNSSRGIRGFIKKYDSKVSLWDFNLGCPSKLSKRLGHGGCLEDLSVIEKILKMMRSATDKPVTIKLRKSGRALEIAKMAEKYVDAIGIHARSVSQGYAGDVDYDFALSLKSKVSVPVIFSGNVDEGNVKKILRDFDFVFVGRSAIGNPGFFSGKRVGFGEYLKLARKYGLFFRQIKYQAMNWTKGMRRARRVREMLVGAKTIGEIERMMKL